MTTLGGLCGTVAAFAIEFEIDGYPVSGLGPNLVKALIGGLIGLSILRLLFWGSFKAMGKTERPFEILRRRG